MAFIAKACAPKTYDDILTNMIGQNTIAYSVGFFIAVIVGHFATSSIVKNMWVYLRTRHPNSSKLATYHGQGAIIGFVERAIYFGFLVAGQPLFVGVWFTLKTISRSPRWGKDFGEVQGRGVFQPFLAGTGMSLLFAASGYGITRLTLTGQHFSIPSACLIGLGLFVVWLICFLESRSAIKALGKPVID